jgi:hypothetical protein
VDPRAYLDDVEKILDPTGTRTPTPSVAQPVASRYTDYAIPVHRTFLEFYNFTFVSELADFRIRGDGG